MKRLMICGACIAAMAAVCASVIMAVGIEIVQREKQRRWLDLLP